ncbi:MAG: hypothetical protein M1817_001181 [Caeruleum heppii]|nr:MAG: hypothetical protein M1817_001181 [Caeruleum heppii]
MKRSAFPAMDRRKSSTLHYQTFPVRPPVSRGRPPSQSPDASSPGSPSRRQSAASGGSHNESPLPKRQLAVLAVIALAEQTALNSISPYLPEMASTFPEVDVRQVGLYVGLIASSYAFAQFATGFFWGWLSDRVGRKPVILIGTAVTAACFIAFGFCKTLWQAVLVQLIMGFFNGNQGVVSTCLGEITDRSNQSKAFVFLPVIYGLGGITGPIVGGLLVKEGSRYPYLPPNLFSASVLIVDLVLATAFMEESLEEARDLPPLGKRVENIFAWLWQFTSSTRPSYLRLNSREHQRRHAHGHADGIDGSLNETESDSDTASQASIPALLPTQFHELGTKEVFHRDTILLLVTYLIFQLSNISFNSLYPIFASSPAPTGRNLSPQEIGLSLSFAGAITILFQVGIFGKLREKMGNRATYRVSLAGFMLAFLLMPFVGYKSSPSLAGLDGKIWLWVEIGAVLLIKTVASVGGLTSALLLITNSAPNHSVLGRLNGLAQTLSAAGRAAGPFLSGGLFSLSVRVQPKGEALAWGVFGGVAFVGFCMSFGIRGLGLEAEGWDEEGGHSEDDDHDDDDDAGEADGLLARDHGRTSRR